MKIKSLWIESEWMTAVKMHTLSLQNGDSADMGVKGKVGSWKKEQYFPFGKIMYDHKIQFAVFAVGSRTKAKTTALIRKIHSRSKVGIVKVKRRLIIQGNFHV